jgi:hypothetical protein
MGANITDVIAMRIITYKGFLIGLAVAICLLNSRTKGIGKVRDEQLADLYPILFSGHYHDGVRGALLVDGATIFHDNLEKVAALFKVDVVEDKAGNRKIKVKTPKGVRVAEVGDSIMVERATGDIYIVKSEQFDKCMKVDNK